MGFRREAADGPEKRLPLNNSLALKGSAIDRKYGGILDCCKFEIQITKWRYKLGRHDREGNGELH